jgi:large conductance mechanosensitive channel
MSPALPTKGAEVLKGFKDFLMRGNVVELAVAVIIGTAFTNIVTAIADHLIRPVIAAIGGSNVTGLAWTIIADNKASTIDFAAVINAVITFLIIAAVVYFGLVLPLKTLQERRKRGEEPGPAEPSDVEVLIEIRDLLRQQQAQLPIGQGTSPFASGPAPRPGGPTGPTEPPSPGPGPRTQ